MPLLRREEPQTAIPSGIIDNAEVVVRHFAVIKHGAAAGSKVAASHSFLSSTVLKELVSAEPLVG
jgi:hypothetical protein